MVFCLMALLFPEVLGVELFPLLSYSNHCFHIVVTWYFQRLTGFIVIKTFHAVSHKALTSASKKIFPCGAGIKAVRDRWLTVKIKGFF